MAALPSINSSNMYENTTSDIIRTVSSSSSTKERRCCLWSSISNIMSRCFKNYSTPITKVEEEVVFSVEDLEDTRVRKISVILNTNNELRYELIWKRKGCLKKKPLTGPIPYIPSYHTSTMIQYLMDCEIKHNAKGVSFLRKRHSWTIRKENNPICNIDLIQCDNTLLYRILRDDKELYIHIKDESNPIKDRIKFLSKEIILGNNNIPELAGLHTKRIINDIEVSLLIGRESLVWQSKRKGTAIFDQYIAERDDVKYIHNGEVILKFDPILRRNRFAFAPVYNKLIDFHPERLRDKIEVNLLVGGEDSYRENYLYIWQIYEKSTKTFHQHKVNKSQSPDNYWLDLQNRNIEIIESIPQQTNGVSISELSTTNSSARVLSVSPSLTKITKTSKIDGKTLFDADQYAITLVNSDHSRVDPLSWAGHAKIIFEYIENKEHKMLEAHFIKKEPFVILRPFDRLRPFPDRTRTYVRANFLVEVLIRDIIRSSKPAYSLGGGNILTNTSNSDVTSNCMSWAIWQLAKIDINIKLPTVGVFDSIIEQAITRPTHYIRSSYLRGPESVQFYYNLNVPYNIRHLFPSRLSLSLETLIQERVGAKDWHVISNSDWTSSQARAKNRNIKSFKQLKCPILISIDIEGRITQLDLTKEILAVIKKETGKIAPKIKEELTKTNSALDGIFNFLDTVNTILGGKPEFTL